MKRLLVAMATLSLLAGTSLAQDKIDPAKKGPTDAVTEKVPSMTSPAAGSSTESGTEIGESRPATKAVGDQIPPMTPNSEEKKGASETTQPGQPPTQKSVE